MMVRRKSDRIVETLGCFDGEVVDELEHLTLVFSPASFPIKWSNSSLSANFLASYFENFFPTNAEIEAGLPQHAYAINREEVRDAINYIANELMENAVKFHYNSELEIEFTIRLDPINLTLLATNSVDPTTMDKFNALISELTTGDPDQLLLEHLERVAENPHSTESGIGFLTIMSTYGAKIGWKFETIQVKGAPEKINVTTMVKLPIMKETDDGK